MTALLAIGHAPDSRGYAPTLTISQGDGVLTIRADEDKWEFAEFEATREQVTEIRDALTAWLGDGWRTGTPDVERMDDIIIQTDDGEVQVGSYQRSGPPQNEDLWGDKYEAPESRKVVAWMPFPKAMAVKS